MIAGVHKLKASLVSLARFRLHHRGGGRKERERVDDEISHSFRCALLRGRELVHLLSMFASSPY